mgnify:CR=1 FL=1
MVMILSHMNHLNSNASRLLPPLSKDTPISYSSHTLPLVIDNEKALNKKSKNTSVSKFLPKGKKKKVVNKKGKLLKKKANKMYSMKAAKKKKGSKNSKKKAKKKVKKTDKKKGKKKKKKKEKKKKASSSKKKKKKDIKGKIKTIKDIVKNSVFST